MQREPRVCSLFVIRKQGEITIADRPKFSENAANVKYGLSGNKRNKSKLIL
jgi:hypothetical protein